MVWGLFCENRFLFDTILISHSCIEIGLIIGRKKIVLFYSFYVFLLYEKGKKEES